MILIPSLHSAHLHGSEKESKQGSGGKASTYTIFLTTTTATRPAWSCVNKRFLGQYFATTARAATGLNANVALGHADWL